jgi:protoheme IX farnesyltransferase
MAAPDVALERPQAADFIALTKPGLTLLSVATAVGGAFLASGPSLSAEHIGTTLLGTALAGAGAASLNQYLERDLDAQMRRTAERPLPAGRISPSIAVTFGLACSLLGLTVFLGQGHFLAAGLTLATLVLYLGVYTPLKRLTPWASIAGAVPGALPPLIGWAVVREDLTLGAWSLFAILFIWQIPHFFSLAMVYRNDYARAGFRTLSVSDEKGNKTAWQVLLYSTALVPASVLPTAFSLLGSIYAAGAIALSCCSMVLGIRLFLRPENRSARTVFLWSIAYLPLLVVLMVVDRL